MMMFLLLLVIPMVTITAQQPLWEFPAEGSNEELAKYRAKRNYTRLEAIEGNECMGYLDNVNSTVHYDLKIWRVRSQTAVQDLGMRGFACDPMTWVAEVLNCDENELDDDLICENGQLRSPTTKAFSGNGGCLTLVAAMNYMHGEGREDWDEFCRIRNSTRHADVSNTYPKSCTEKWRSCPYNIDFSGYVNPFVNFDERRFRLRAHNIQGNWKGWQRCAHGNYESTSNWPRYIQTTYRLTNLVSIYEGGSMQKCAGQDASFIHVSGSMMGTFRITQPTARRSTHTCLSPYSCDGVYCYDSDNDSCIVDFDTLKDDDVMCGPWHDGPRTEQSKDAWCCGDACALENGAIA